RMFFQLYNLPVVLVRPFVAYGPGQNKNKLIPFVIFSSLKNQCPQLSSGEWTADWIYVDDVIQGILLAASAPGIEGCCFDLGSGKLIKTRLLVEQLSDLVNPAIRPLFGAVADRPLEQVRTAKIDYTAAVLGWKPATSLREGLVRTIEWCKSQALADDLTKIT